MPASHLVSARGAGPGLTRTISGPLYAILICTYVLIQVGLIFFKYSLFYLLFLKPVLRCSLPARAVGQRASAQGALAASPFAY